MKNIYTIILLSIANVSFSQDPRIFDTNWRLTNIIVNGVNNYPPNSSTNINFVSPTEFYAHACNTMLASVSFENNYTHFSAANYSYTLDFCFDTAAENYQNIYFPFFLDGNNPDPSITNYFTYNISEDQGVKTLVINSMFNQQAIYSSVGLSNQNFERLHFSLYPNPSEDSIEILTSEDTANDTTLECYNELGMICKTAQLNSRITTVGISDLSAGVYYVKIKTGNQTTVKKLIKK